MKECWVIGSGPSWKKIETNEDMIVVNREIDNYPKAKYFVTTDYGWGERAKSIKTTRVFVLELHGESVKDGKIVRDTSLGIEYDLSPFDLIIKSRRLDGVSRSFGDFRSCANSGICAIQLALVLGYLNIHLVGFDFGFTDKQYHCESGVIYPEDKQLYKNHFELFEAELKDFRNIYPNVIIRNHSEKSPIRKYFGYEPL
jgi:hypothetical protein